MTGRNLWGGPGLVLALGLCCLLLSGCKRNTASREAARIHLAAALKRLEEPARPEEQIADDTKTPAPPDAPALTLDSPVLKNNAKLTGTLTAELGKGEFHLIWIDAAGRIVSAYELDARQTSGATTPFSFARPTGCIGESHTLALIRLVKGKPEKDGVFEPLAQVHFRAAQPLAPWNDYLVVCDGGCESREPEFWQNLREAGVNAGLAGALESGGVCIAHNFPFIGEVVSSGQPHPFMTAPWADGATPYSRTRNARDLERKPPLFDETALLSVKRAIDASAANKSLAAPFAWSLGSGLSLTEAAWPLDFDMSPETLAIFQAWLEERHGSIANLNSRWATRYSAWAQVRPPSTDDVKAAHNPLYAQRLAELTPPPGASISGATPAADTKKFETRNGVTAFALNHGELRAPGGENFAAWSDWREFGAFAFARILREYRAHLRAAAPTLGEPPRVGMRGALGPSSWGGWDWAQLSRTLDWAESESPQARELARSFAPSESSSKGGARPLRFVAPFSPRGDADVYRLWDGWLRGDVGCFVKQPERWAVPEAPAKAEAQKYLSELPLLTQGLTLLREGARRVGDPVAIYYSPRSIALHWMLDSEGDGAFWLSRSGPFEAQHSSALLQLEAWQALLEDLGYAPRYVQPQQLLAGELRKTKTKVLVLPKILSLSEEEARAIRDFARSGGIVIADGECGTFTGEGRRALAEKPGAEPRALGVLDKDFGIARRDFRALELNGQFEDNGARSRVNLRSGEDGEPVGPSSPELRVLEPGIVPSGAHWHAASEGGAPALLVKVLGSGRFVYLNLALQDYARLCENAAPEFQFHGFTPEQYAEKYGVPRGGEALRLVLGDMLSEAAAENPLKVRYEDGTSVRGIRRTRFTLGKGATLFGLLPRSRVESGDDGAEHVRGANVAAIPDVTLAWNAQRHWYDVSTGTYLGVGSAVKTSLDPHRAALLAALPYRVEKIGLKLRRTDSLGNFKLAASIAVSSGEAALHVLHLEIYDPLGNRLPHYAANVPAENGSWSGEIRLALNDPAGIYRVVLRDVVSGVSTEAQLAKDGAAYLNLNIDK